MNHKHFILLYMIVKKIMKKTRAHAKRTNLWHKCGFSQIHTASALILDYKKYITI